MVHNGDRNVGFQIEICAEGKLASQSKYRLKLVSEREWDLMPPSNELVRAC